MAITTIHQDIIETHILTKLDGPSLATASCSCTQLHALCTQENLWRNICTSTWPSVNHPLLRHTISKFPAGHLSFYADSFPTLHHRTPKPNHHHQLPTSELISAVDIHYENKHIYSNVKVTDATGRSFSYSPLWVHLIGPKQIVRTNAQFHGEEETFLSHLEQNMSLSWIVIDPAQKRAANISSLQPVSAQKHWLTNEIHLEYATIMIDDRSGSSGFVRYKIQVMCGRKQGGRLYIREVSLQVEDMDGKCLSGKDSLVILQEAMESGERKKAKTGEDRERYEEFLKVKRERRERRLLREMKVCILCVALGFTIFLGLLFWALRGLF